MPKVARLPSKLTELALSDWRRGFVANAGTSWISPNLDAIAQRKGLEEYRACYERDDTCKSCIDLTVAGIVSAGFDIVAGDPSSRESVRSAEQGHAPDDCDGEQDVFHGPLSSHRFQIACFT